MRDTINRQDAIAALQKWQETETWDAWKFINDEPGPADVIAALPSIEDQGFWIPITAHGWQCSVCGEVSPYACITFAGSKEPVLREHYCPACGAGMKIFTRYEM